MFFKSRQRTAENKERKQAVFSFVQAPSPEAPESVLEHVCAVPTEVFRGMEAKQVTHAAKILMKLARAEQNFVYASKALDMLRAASDKDPAATALHQNLLTQINKGKIISGIDDKMACGINPKAFETWCENANTDGVTHTGKPEHTKLPSPAPAT